MQEILCSRLTSASPAPKPEKESDAAALMTVTIAAHVDPPPSPAKFSTLEDAVSGEWDTAKGPRVTKPGPQILSVEPIVPPPSVGTNLSMARLITAGEVVGTPQQQRSAEDAGAASTSSGNILITPSGWQHVVLTELTNDPMLTTETLKQFQDSLEIYTGFPWCVLCLIHNLIC
jgi:hypothetical protein